MHLGVEVLQYAAVRLENTLLPLYRSFVSGRAPPPRRTIRRYLHLVHLSYFEKFFLFLVIKIKDIVRYQQQTFR